RSTGNDDKSAVKLPRDVARRSPLRYSAVLHGEKRQRGPVMTCYVMLEFTAKPGTGPAVLQMLRQGLPPTRNKDGCNSLEVTINQDHTDNMLLVMRWATRKHYETYRAWRESVGDVQRFAEATVNGLSTRFFDISDALQPDMCASQVKWESRS